MTPREPRTTDDDLGRSHTWGTGPEVVFLSNPLADPVAWSAGVRDELLALGYQVTTFAHRPDGLDWRSVVACVGDFVRRRPEPVALVGWSQGAAIAQEVALAVGPRVRAAVLLATYGRQNEIDKLLQASWDHLVSDGSDELRAALRLLTAFPPERLADDGFVRALASQGGWAEKADPVARRRAGTFIATYQQRLEALRQVVQPCLVMGFELDTDTFAARAREVAAAIPGAEYHEVPDVGHAAPISDPEAVWPSVVRFLERQLPPRPVRNERGTSVDAQPVPPG